MSYIKFKKICIGNLIITTKKCIEDGEIGLDFEGARRIVDQYFHLKDIYRIRYNKKFFKQVLEDDNMFGYHLDDWNFLNIDNQDYEFNRRLQFEKLDKEVYNG